MVEQMSRSRGNRSGRRSFRSATPPPSPKQEGTTNQKINITSDEKDSSTAVFEPVTEDTSLIEEQVLLLSEDESITNSHDVENKETITSHKRPPSPSLIIPIATKKSLSDGISEEISVEDESKLNFKLFGNKLSGVTTNTGPFQHIQVPIRSPSMPPPKLESSASKVLTEELQKQLGQENSKLRSLIIKEVRRPGKSELCMLSLCLHTLCQGNTTYFSPLKPTF